MWRPNTLSISPAGERDVLQEGWYLFFMAFSIYGWHTAPLTHFCAEGQMGQQAGLMDGPCALPTTRPLLLCWGLHSPITQALPDKFSSAEAKSFRAPSCPANAPKCAGEGPAALPASTVPGSWAAAVHMQTHPTSAPTPSFCALCPAVCIHTEGEPLP